MNKSNNSTTDAAQSEGLPNSMSALERRRFLFNTAGKGAVVGVALANPMRSMAQVAGTPVLVCKHPTSTQLVMCSVSGMQSAIGSRQTNQILASGYSPGYWGQVKDDLCLKTGSVWRPNMKQTFPARLTGWSWTTPVRTVLTTSSLPADLSLELLVVNRNKCTKPGGAGDVAFVDYANSEERHWMCAIFNAAIFFPLGKFPYDWQIIRAVANGTNTSISKSELYKLVKSLEGYNEP